MKIPLDVMHLESELRRELGPFSATCVVIGAIVGVGIFFTPKNVALLVGSGELAVIIGAFLDPKYRRGAVIGGLWVLAAIACYAIFFRRPRRDTENLQVPT